MVGAIVYSQWDWIEERLKPFIDIDKSIQYKYDKKNKEKNKNTKLNELYHEKKRKHLAEKVYGKSIDKFDEKKLE